MSSEVELDNFEPIDTENEPLLQESLKKDAYFKNLQTVTNETIDILENNKEKLEEREKKLYDVEDGMAKLEHTARKFSGNAKKVKNRFWLENMGWKILLGILIVLLVIVIIAIVFITGFS